MKLDWRVAVGISIAMLVVGGIAVAYLLDPSIFSPSSPSSGGLLINSNGPPQASDQPPGGSYVVHQVTSTATGIYCNCTDTDSQG